MSAQRMAVLNDEGRVVNLILASDGFNPGSGLTMRPATAEDVIDFATERFSTLDEAKFARLAELAHRRWVAEQAFSFNGMAILLDDGTQRRIGGALQYLDLSGETSVRWQVARGVFTTLSADALKSLAVAAGAHVQACFANVETLAAEIDAATTISAVTAISLDRGWP